MKFPVSTLTLELIFTCWKSGFALILLKNSVVELIGVVVLIGAWTTDFVVHESTNVNVNSAKIYFFIFLAIKVVAKSFAILTPNHTNCFVWPGLRFLF